jgi:hypothetical protein
VLLLNLSEVDTEPLVKLSAPGETLRVSSLSLELADFLVLLVAAAQLWLETNIPTSEATEMAFLTSETDCCNSNIKLSSVFKAMLPIELRLGLFSLWGEA